MGEGKEGRKGGREEMGRVGVESKRVGKWEG